MKVAVIIPTKNEEKNILYLINSIKFQTLKDLIIIVADAFSTDDTRKKVKEAGCIVVDGGHPSVGRNNGAKKAIKLGATVLIFIDADIILPKKTFLKESLDEFYKRNLDVAGTLQMPLSLEEEIDEKDPFGTSAISIDFRYKLFCIIPNYFIKKSERKKKPLMQQCMFVKANVFNSVGGFDETIEFGEDQLYAQYLFRKGYKFGVLEEGGKVLASPIKLKEKGFFSMLMLNLFYLFLTAIGYKIKRNGIFKYF